jgi:hypothetical protein
MDDLESQFLKPDPIALFFEDAEGFAREIGANFFMDDTCLKHLTEKFSQARPPNSKARNMNIYLKNLTKLFSQALLNDCETQ